MLCFRCGSYNPENAQKCSVCGQGFIDESGKAVGPPRRESKTTQPASIFVPGEMVAGRYRVGELLGQGGVGAVYRARDLEIDVDIALKGITPNLLQTEEEQKNFSKQIKGARKLQHPNIVRIYDEGHEGNRRFFTMKFLEGLTLRKIIRLRHEKGQPFTAEELVPIFHQLAAALDYAHKSTWHGDLKPENIIILPDLLKVTDFNLVKALPLKPFLGIAKSRSKGFPYIAPELRVEANTIDGRADNYALGVILAEMLTGLVFEGHYSRAMTAALEQLPTKLDGLVRKAVSEHPDGRYQRAGDLAKDLEAALGALQGPLPAPTRPQQPALSGAQTVPNPKPAGPPSTMPPPPPDETGPSHSPAPMLSSDDVPPHEPPREPSDIVEIGQSQVLLLQSGITTQPGELAEAARRLMAAGSNPEDTLDEHTGGASSGDLPTAPRGAPVPKEMVVEPPRGPASSGERPRDPAKLVEALYSDERDDGLIPPPLPDEALALDKTSDPRVKLPGDDDEDSLEQTDERLLAVRTRKKDPPKESPRDKASTKPAAKDASDASDASDDDAHASGEQSKNSASEIHDALTALKPHPNELLDESVREERAAAQRADREKAIATGDVSRERTDKVRDRDRGRTQPPPIEDEDEDSLKETLSADVLRAAKERSSPSLHRAEALPPPVIAPPPVLRPVSPPRRAGSSSAPLAVAAIIGVVALAAAIVVWRFVIPHDKTDGTSGPDHAIVSSGHGPDTVLLAAADAGPRVADVVPVIEDTTPKVDGTKPEVVKVDGTKPDIKPEVIKVDGTKPVETNPADTKPPVDTKPVDTKPVDTKPVDTRSVETNPADTKPTDTAVVAAAAPGTCPKGMALVEAGSFTFGSDGSDPMRNFGEQAAGAADVAKPYCIDYYEQPNGKDALPTVGVSWSAAKNACDRLGRRLCSEKEWERACKGPSSSRFPYGNTYDADVCNTEDAGGKPRALANALAFKKCRSAYKVFMMSGNADEWVLDSVNGNHITKGGAADRPDFSSRCAARRTPEKGALATVGFRCCADPH